MIVTSVLLLSIASTKVLAQSLGSPSRGKITPCGTYAIWGNDYWDEYEFEQPCTGDAKKAFWIWQPFNEDGTIIICGDETTVNTSVSELSWGDCPNPDQADEDLIEGQFDIIPVDDVFEKQQSELELCGSNTLMTGPRETEMLQPCTGNDHKGQWLSDPFSGDGTLDFCGKEEWFENGQQIVLQHRPCPYNAYIEGEWRTQTKPTVGPLPNPSLGTPIPCGDYTIHYDSIHNEQKSFDRPCTGNANKASWLARPFQENDGLIIVCGTETSGTDGKMFHHSPCPTDESRQWWIEGRFDLSSGMRPPVTPERFPGSVTVCGTIKVWSGRRDVREEELDQPCTGNANKASWLSEPYLKDGTIVLCGRETSGQRGGGKTKHARCPRYKKIRGRYDSRVPDESFGQVVRTLCDGFSFKKGNHVGDGRAAQACNSEFSHEGFWSSKDFNDRDIEGAMLCGREVFMNQKGETVELQHRPCPLDAFVQGKWIADELFH